MAIGASPVQQVAKTTWTSGGTVTWTITAPTNGNFLVLVYGATSASSNLNIASIAQTGATWVKAITNQAGRVCEIWYAANVSGAGTLVTATLTTTPVSDGQTGGVISEWSGVATSSSLDGTPATNSGTSTAPATGSYTPTAGLNELLIQAGRIPGTPSAGPTNSFTQFTVGQTTVDSTSWRVVASTSGSYSTDYTTSSGAWGMALASFKAPGGSSPKNLPPGLSKSGVI